MQATELVIPVEPPLGATLTVPARPRAAALILQGAGVHDRDGNMRATGFNSTLYRRLARELARCGLACLRYDKRGHDKPAGFAHDYSIPQRLADAAAALGVLRESVPGVPMFAIGHSEGALVAAKLAETEPVAGAVCLAAPFGNLFALHHARARSRLDQARSGARAKAEKAVEFAQRLEALFKENAPVLPEKFAALAKPYLGRGYEGWESYEWLAGHWSEELKSEPRVPMLVVQGGRDARLWPDNAQRWQQWCESRPNAEFLLIEHMGHDLNDARHKSYRVDKEVIGAICAWTARFADAKA